MTVFKSSKNATFNPQEINIINSGTCIKGDVQSEGDLRIDGNVNGNIQVKSKLVLGPLSKVEGNIRAQNCDISGHIIGNVNITELLTVKASANIAGDINSSKLIIESGAEFNGKSTMGISKATSNGHQKPVNPIDVKPAVTGDK